MTIDSDALSALIGDVYACALEPDRWLATLERLAGQFGACSSAIYDRGTQGVSFHCEWGSTPNARKDFAARHMRQSPLLTMGWHFDVDQPITLGSFMQPEELRRTRFYRDWLVPQGWFDFIGAILAKSADRISVVMFLRPEGMAAPGERDKALLRLLCPHLRRALEIRGIVESATVRAGDLAATLDLVPTPILLFDSAGECIEANAAATRDLSRSDLLCLARDGLRAADGAPDGRRLAPTRSLALSRPDGRRYAAHVMPLAGPMCDRLTGNRRARSAMFLQRIGDAQPLPGEVLVKLYGLTPAETRMLGLIGQGTSAAEAADLLGITMTTARTHLRNIFAKTGARRQADLVRMTVSALPRAAPPPD